MTNLQLVENANYQIVHEVYDLLSDDVNESFQALRTNGSTEWLLTKPNMTAPLRKMRFGTFRPIYKPGFLNRRHVVELTIMPHVINWDGSKFVEIALDDTHYVDSIAGANGRVPIRVNRGEYSFDFDGSFDSLSHNINDFIQTYFADFYSNGNFVFTNGSSTETSEKTLAGTFDDAKTAGAHVGNLIDNYSYPLVVFNTNDEVIPTFDNILITCIWSKFASVNHYLVFTLDAITNFHAFSIDSGLLYGALFNDTASYSHSGNYYVNDIDAVNYDEDLLASTRAVVDSGLTISLCSSFAGNLSGKIFTGENLYHTVDIEMFPSTMYFPITIKNKYGVPLDIETLKQVYDQITVGVDYVYLTY